MITKILIIHEIHYNSLLFVSMLVLTFKAFGILLYLTLTKYILISQKRKIRKDAIDVFLIFLIFVQHFDVNYKIIFRRLIV